MSMISGNLPPPSPPSRQRISDRVFDASAVGGIDPTGSTTSASEVDGRAIAGDGSATDTGHLEPGSLGDRIDDLLAQQVGTGTLTQAQADTLKSAFGSLDAETGGVDTRQRPSGPPPGPPPGSSADDAQSGSDATASSADSSETVSSEDLLASFVKQLQSVQDRTRAYGADGTRTGGQSASPRLLNFQA